MNSKQIELDFTKFALSNTKVRPSAIHRMHGYVTPYIMEERELHVTQLDVFSRLMLDRVIFLGTDINDDVANVIQAQLLYLESVDKDRNIQIYINSPGGNVYAGLGIYDTMHFINPTISTICTGMCASMAAILLSAGTKGMRSALPHSRVMIHQPSGGAEGMESDIEIQANQIKIVKNELAEILGEHTGQPLKKILKDIDRDYWMKAIEAKEYGLIDTVLNKREK
jgi:ATP-dependent Clp protease protease subunit